jgi:hypothetical protein
MSYESESFETDQSTALAVVDHQHDDGFAAGAAHAGRSLIQGSIVKFDNGLWKINGSLIDKHEQFIPVQLKMAWVRWENNRPVEYVWPKPNGYLPTRETLSHADPDTWPPGLGGAPKDVWQDTRFVYLADFQTASINTVTNSTYGMRTAYHELARSVANKRSAHPGILPVVELASAEMKLKVGTKLRPHFKIVDWQERGGKVIDTPSVAQIAKAKKMTVADDLDDSIPF